MGNYWAKEYKIGITGLDGAGKTTFLYGGTKDCIMYGVPTMGYNVEYLKVMHKKNIKLNCSCWDTGGSSAIRFREDSYNASLVDALIFIINLHDSDRFESAVSSLKSISEYPSCAGKPFLIIGNHFINNNSDNNNKEKIKLITEKELEDKIAIPNSMFSFICIESTLFEDEVRKCIDKIINTMDNLNYL